MTLEIFLLGLMIVSIFTGLFTEGIKKLLDEMTVKYPSFRIMEASFPGSPWYASDGPRQDTTAPFSSLTDRKSVV